MKIEYSSSDKERHKVWENEKHFLPSITFIRELLFKLRSLWNKKYEKIKCTLPSVRGCRLGNLWIANNIVCMFLDFTFSLSLLSRWEEIFWIFHDKFVQFHVFECYRNNLNLLYYKNLLFWFCFDIFIFALHMKNIIGEKCSLVAIKFIQWCKIILSTFQNRNAIANS